MIYDLIPSEIAGQLILAADETGLRHLNFVHGRHPLAVPDHWRREPAGLAAVRQQLEDYFAGRRQRFDLPLHPVGTPFQRKVWAALGRIPYGHTISYAELARRIGQPNALRAVGAANGRNPIAIIIPCHRVIGSDGSLTGFGGGTSVKQRLLRLENSAWTA